MAILICVQYKVFRIAERVLRILARATLAIVVVPPVMAPVLRCVVILPVFHVLA